MRLRSGSSLRSPDMDQRLCIGLFHSDAIHLITGVVASGRGNCSPLFFGCREIVRKFPCWKICTKNLNSSVESQCSILGKIRISNTHKDCSVYRKIATSCPAYSTCSTQYAD